MQGSSSIKPPTSFTAGDRVNWTDHGILLVNFGKGNLPKWKEGKFMKWRTRQDERNTRQGRDSSRHTIWHSVIEFSIDKNLSPSSRTKETQVFLFGFTSLRALSKNRTLLMPSSAICPGIGDGESDGKVILFAIFTCDDKAEAFVAIEALCQR